MLGHIRRQDHANHTSAEHFALVCAKHFNKVVLGGQKNFHRLRGMPILLHRLVVVAERAISHKVYMISIVEAIVGKVMTCRRCHSGDKVDVAKLSNLADISCLDHHVEHLSDVKPMQVVVVGNICTIPLPDLT